MAQEKIPTRRQLLDKLTKAIDKRIRAVQARPPKASIPPRSIYELTLVPRG